MLSLDKITMLYNIIEDSTTDFDVTDIESEVKFIRAVMDKLMDYSTAKSFREFYIEYYRLSDDTIFSINSPQEFIQTFLALLHQENYFSARKFFRR